ncbi:hypothetical protein LUZ63_007219 [Rhynchospora breviuscula]|uniref:Cyclic nucleotide-binding domain-containing protein n=1 Tax=Rhynchospora breviuscula TaxID=2022672 RepID=A0A9Q0CS20_9POAL|nr:hypothetical protein LUZ63_007219 [Rhynchospora breviuscula]
MAEELGRSDLDHVQNKRNNDLLKCDSPDCTECPAAYRGYDSRNIKNIRCDNVDGWPKKLIANVLSYSIMNPHRKDVQRWNKFLAISCLVTIFIDPLFVFLLSVEKTNKCMVLHWSFGTAIAVARSITDIIFLLHMILQFRLAYVAPESRVVGAGDLVDEPMKIALHYLRGYFIFDLLVVLPLLQVMILVVIPKHAKSFATNYTKNRLYAIVLLQYFLRIFRFVPLLVGQTASGFIFESAWANFVINLLMFVLAGHVVGSLWYLFGLQRVNHCLRDTCASFNKTICSSLIDCAYGGDFRNSSQQFRQEWRDYGPSTNCLDTSSNQFSYGIFQQAVLLTTEHSVITRYSYSLVWGFQQISTLAGNQIPSYFVWEALFTMAIVGLGLLLFALLIGNMQNFLQSLGRRRLEMQLRQRDVEQWMSHRRLPEDLRERVRLAERFLWAANRGVNEEELMSKLPEDIQRDIRRHFFKFLNKVISKLPEDIQRDINHGFLKFLEKVRIFTLLDEPILDAICENLRQKLYIRGSDLFYQGGTVEKLVFIVRGNLESFGADGHVVFLQEGAVCGEELITWCLEQHSSGHHKDKWKGRHEGLRLFSERTVRCLTDVEALILCADDLEQVIPLFSRVLRSPRVQRAIRYESPYWRQRAATVIQVAWRYRKRRLRRSKTPHNAPFRTSSILRSSEEHKDDILTEEQERSRSNYAEFAVQPELTSPSRKKFFENGVKLSDLGVQQKKLLQLCLDQPKGFTEWSICSVGKYFYRRNSIPIVLRFEDIKELFKNEWLNVSIIQTFMMYLSESLSQSGGNKEIGFMDPEWINMSQLEESRQQVIEYIVAALKEQCDKRVILAPCYKTSHWFLFVILPFIGRVYILDSLPEPIPNSLKEVFEEAFKSYYHVGYATQKDSIVKWHDFKCPRQPEFVECGYYVCCFMNEIVFNFAGIFPMCLLPDSYSTGDIEKMKETWARYVVENVCKIVNNES